MCTSGSLQVRHHEVAHLNGTDHLVGGGVGLLDVAGAPALVEHGGHRAADVVGGFAHVEAVAQHHLDGQDLRERVRNCLLYTSH